MKREAHNADAYNNLAWLYYVKGKNLDEAERLAQKALELNPSKKNIYSDTLEKIRGVKKCPFSD
ncbi:MAG: tetratricopeptide repeat protein [Deltaproteobacteria bacterium]|nr:tetratricopeptide repeat protein [Deltaproteobacteria bacterium]